ncbi:MAG: hypothetical protein EAZ92_02525 [Candidatus Kapaibacterium sp.]|nr:MAG: hypothetical protein EAZ92_02525 [Candidatus Kapabacteria bacterium]
MRHSFRLFLVFGLLCLISSIAVHAQTLASKRYADSLYSEYNRRQRQGMTSDTATFALTYNLAKELRDRQPDSAIVVATYAIRIAQELNDSNALTRAHHALGYAYKNRGMFSLAVDNFLKGLQIAQQRMDTTALSMNTSGLGATYNEQQRHHEAHRYFALSIRFAESIADTQALQIAFNNMGYVLWCLQKFDSALVYHERALRLAELKRDSLRMAISYINFGVCYQSKQDFTRSLEYQQKALAMHRNFGNTRNEMLALFYIGWTYKDMRRAADALPYLRSAVQLADSLNMHSQLQNAFSLLSETYSALGQFDDATHAMKRYASIKDSLYVAERAAQMSAMETLYKTTEKDKEIRLLQVEKQEEARRRALYGAGLVVVAAFAGILILLNRQKTRANEEILRQKNILEEQAREIELANAKLNETNLQLEHLDNEKNEFLGIAAHDLKSPLAGIMASAGLMRKFGAHMSEDERIKSLQTIEQTSQRMSDIISNLLDTNALESGKMNLNPQAFNFAALTQETLEHYRERALAKNITFYFSSNFSESITNTDALVFADPNASAQVLDNLISNAVKYSPHGKNVYVRLKQYVQSNSQQTRIRLEVQDEGQGISDEDMSKLFGKFTRLAARPTGGEDSTGLGLSIVKKMVEAMNGKVWCDSETGNGATFILELPKAASLL